jgi:iron-sulfur cluster insertion protein
MAVITHMAALRREIISMSVESFTPTALQFPRCCAQGEEPGR